MNGFRRLYHTSLASQVRTAFDAVHSATGVALAVPVTLRQRSSLILGGIVRPLAGPFCPFFTLQRRGYFMASMLVLASTGLQNRRKEGSRVGKRILIVDDGEEVRQVLRAVFEARSTYEICGEASNGVEAVAMARELKPDLILLDVAMPMLNGVEVASVLAGSIPSLPVVLYTMYNEMLGLTLATAVGAKAVVSKADGIGKLLECVRNLLEPPMTPLSPETSSIDTSPPNKPTTSIEHPKE
jgi:CheY-like chemotaxis protein